MPFPCQSAALPCPVSFLAFCGLLARLFQCKKKGEVFKAPLFSFFGLISSFIYPLDFPKAQSVLTLKSNDIVTTADRPKTKSCLLKGRTIWVARNKLRVHYLIKVDSLIAVYFVVHMLERVTSTKLPLAALSAENQILLIGRGNDHGALEIEAGSINSFPIHPMIVGPLQKVF